MRAVVLLLLAIVSGSACAGDDDDSAALSLQGVGAPGKAGASPASLTTEGALTDAAQRAGAAADEQRLSFDFRYDERWAPKWRAVLADRLDLDWFGAYGGAQQFNTLKQAYLSWQPQADVLFDAGRVNARQGVALGYNPTDFFRADALRTVDSLDPGSLRDERLGTVMVRGEKLWDGGAFTALYAPRLAAAPNAAPGPFSADFGATNHQNQWLLSWSERIAAGWTPQLLLFGTPTGSPQFGLNLTSALGVSTVAYLEAAGGRAPSLWAQAQGLPDANALRARVATGVTYSANSKLSLTLEYEYDGAALSRSGWFAAQQGSPLLYARYRYFGNAQQEPPTQEGAFLYASWQDVLVRHLDLSAFVRLDLIDHSRLPWTELRYHWSQIDAALRWQNYLGGATSDFGASAAKQTWQLLLDYYL